jgi:hypothetical protein
LPETGADEDRHPQITVQARYRALGGKGPQPLKSLIGRAGALEGRSITDCVIATLERDAVKVVREHEILLPSTADCGFRDGR